jgi:hypothetical protein
LFVSPWKWRVWRENTRKKSLLVHDPKLQTMIENKFKLEILILSEIIPYLITCKGSSLVENL